MDAATFASDNAFELIDLTNTQVALTITAAATGSVIDASNVTFDGFNEADILFALGDGNDNVTGSTLGDVIAGGAGFDDLSGGNGDDTITGGADDDSLNGNAGADTIEGGDGNDTIDTGAGGGTVSW